MKRALALALVLSALAASVRAQEPDQATWVERAEALEEAFDPRGALEAWRSAESARPGSRLASRARTRAAWLESRNEGDFAPLAALMRFTAIPRRERGADAVARFETEIAAMPDGRVRIESRLAAAGEWTRLGETERALAAWDAVLSEPSLQEGERGLVHESIARARMDAGDTSGALAVLDSEGLADTGLHHVAERAARAERFVPLAWSVVVAFVIVLGVAIARAEGEARRDLARAISGMRVAIALWIGAVPWAIARSWGDESSAAFSLAGVGLALLVLASFALGEVLASARWRAAAASLACLTAFAIAYLAVVARGEALPFA